MGRTVFVLHSALAPNAVADALRRSIDEQHWTLFSLSGYKGNLPLLGEVSENTFKVQKRKYYRNDFAGQFYARFAAEPEGTRIEGYFDCPRWGKILHAGLALFHRVGGHADLCGHTEGRGDGRPSYERRQVGRTDGVSRAGAVRNCAAEVWSSTREERRAVHAGTYPNHASRSHRRTRIATRLGPD